MRNALMDWISIHTTPRIVIALLLLVGCVLVAAACCIIVLYPNFSDKNPIYLVLLTGLGIFNYGTHKLRVNALLRELRHIVHKDGAP